MSIGSHDLTQISDRQTGRIAGTYRLCVVLQSCGSSKPACHRRRGMVTVSGLFCVECCCVSLRALLNQSSPCRQDGLVCTHDLRSQALTARIRVSHEEAVPSLLTSSARPDCVLASAGCDLFEFDLRKVCVMLVYTLKALLHKSSHCTLVRSTKSFILLKGNTENCVRQQTCTSAEINQLAACPERNLLAAADDDGCVTIIDPSSHTYHCQTLSGRHDNICSSVLFRQHKHNQGGLLYSL